MDNNVKQSFQSSSGRTFKATHSFEKRKEEARRLRQKYPDRVPVICEPEGFVVRGETRAALRLDKKKFLVPGDLNGAQFMYVIRKRCNLKPDEAIFIFIQNKLLPGHLMMSQVYDKYKDDDGMLYCYVSKESTFG